MRSGKGRQAPHLNKNREPYCSKLQAARIELVAWGDQAANWNNDAIKMLIMTKTKDGPEFPGGYSSAKALERIAASLERLAGAQAGPCDFGAANAFVFAAGAATLVPVPRVNRVDIGLLRGIDQARETLLANTERFAQNFAANNALLWGARGMGKSALIKAVHATINAQLAAFPDSKPLRSPASGDHPTSGFRVWRSPWLRGLSSRRARGRAGAEQITRRSARYSRAGRVEVAFVSVSGRTEWVIAGHACGAVTLNVYLVPFKGDGSGALLEIGGAEIRS
jgi:Protein of unknown function (DUF815)